MPKIDTIFPVCVCRQKAQQDRDWAAVVVSLNHFPCVFVFRRLPHRLGCCGCYPWLVPCVYLCSRGCHIIWVVVDVILDWFLCVYLCLGGCHIIVGTVTGLLSMFNERGVGPLRGLCALLVDDVFTICSDKKHLAALVDLVVLVYNQLDNPGNHN